MTSIECFSIEDSSRWDTVVATFVDHDVYHLSGYVRAFKIHGDGTPLLIYYEDSNVRGINVVMLRDIADDARFTGRIAHGTLFDIVTPYGYGGWLIEGEDKNSLFAAYTAWCLGRSVVSEFVRYHPVLANQISTESFYEVIPLGTTVCMDLTSKEGIWNNLTAKNRNVIRKAKKNGIVIHHGREAELFEKFRIIYNGTMDRDQADRYYYFGSEFYQSIMDDLPDNAEVFHADLPDGSVVAAAIIMNANGRLNYHLSGSLREFRHLAPTNLLLYEAAVWGHDRGCLTFHLGGGVGSAEDGGLYAFKKAFYRGDPLRFHIGRKIYMPDAYQRLVDLRGDSVEGKGFFPRYRA